VKRVRGLYIGLGAKIVGAKRLTIGHGAQIMPQAMIVVHGSGRMEIGERTTISMYSRVAALGYVKIGNNVAMGPHVFIADYNHKYRDINRPIKFQGNAFTPMPDGQPNIQIGDDAWLETNVVVVGNIRIGKHSVIGANSVVTKDIPDYSVAVGSPAKVIKRYDFGKSEWVKVK